MAKAIISDSTLTAIADAIREKTGSANTMTLAQMATAISGISTGGGGLQFPATITAGDTPVMVTTVAKSASGPTLEASGCKIAVPKAGTYRFVIFTSILNSAGTVQLYKNGTAYGTSQTASSLVATTLDIACAENDEDEIEVWIAKGTGGYFGNGCTVHGMAACINWEKG